MKNFVNFGAILHDLGLTGSEIREVLRDISQRKKT